MSQSTESAPVFQGILLGAAGGMQEAKRIIADVLERNPRDGMALAARFELEMSSEDREAALVTAEILADVREGDADTLMKAGLLMRRNGKLAEAIALFETADTKDPENPDILGHLGTTRLATGDWPGAEAALMDVRRLRPEDPRTPYYLGNIALLRDDETAARAFYTESLELDDKIIVPLLNLAQWLNEKERSDEAIQLVKDALERMPTDERALQLLRTLQAG